MLAEQQIAVPRDVAARLARLSKRQVDYWASTGLIKPTTDTKVPQGRRVRLYGFVELLALLVAAELRSRHVSLQHIRVIVEHLRSRGYDQPLTELRYATVGNHVYFQHPDGTWEGDLRPDQLIVQEVLQLKPLRERILAEASQRERGQAGRIERRRGTLGSKQVLAGTRVPVDTVVRYLESGRSVAEVLKAFPVLTEADVIAVRDSAIA